MSTAPRRGAVLTAVLVVAAGLLTLTAAAAAAADGGVDIPSVDVSPADRSPSAPNGGQWFVFSLPSEGTTTGTARIKNPADVAQAVTLSSRDVAYTSDGTPSLVDGAQSDVGAWITIGTTEVTVPAQGVVDVTFSVTVPSHAEPGDHVGAILATARPQGGDALSIIKRVATRLFVTVPGEATRGYRIKEVSSSLDSVLWPRSLSVRTVLENTGRIRLTPAVTAGGEQSTGADVLLARATEPYRATVTVPWYGGRVHYDVRVATGGGVIQTRRASRVVVPWALVAIVLVSVVVLAFVAQDRGNRRLRRKRHLGRLEAELVRLSHQRSPAADSVAR